MLGASVPVRCRFFLSLLLAPLPFLHAPSCFIFRRKRNKKTKALPPQPKTNENKCKKDTKKLKPNLQTDCFFDSLLLSCLLACFSRFFSHCGARPGRRVATANRNPPIATLPTQPDAAKNRPKRCVIIWNSPFSLLVGKGLRDRIKKKERKACCCSAATATAQAQMEMPVQPVIVRITEGKHEGESGLCVRARARTPLPLFIPSCGGLFFRSASDP